MYQTQNNFSKLCDVTGELGLQQTLKYLLTLYPTTILIQHFYTSPGHTFVLCPSDADTVASMSFGGAGLLTRSLGHCDVAPRTPPPHTLIPTHTHSPPRTRSTSPWQQWSSSDAIVRPHLFKWLTVSF